MRPSSFDDPRLLVVNSQELVLSGLALLQLMRAVLDRGVPFRFRARGWSMAPFIRDGDIVTVTRVLGTRLGLGAVVAFVSPATGGLVVHRVVGTEGDASLTKGDGVAGRSDGTIPAESILGTVTRIEREGRNVLLGLGPERRLVALISRARLLVPLRAGVAACRRTTALCCRRWRPGPARPPEP